MDKAKAYGYVAEWDGEYFTSLVVEYNADTGTWNEPVPYVVKLLGGTPLDYVSYALVPSGVVDGVELLAMILHFKAKEKDAAITKAQGKTVGGCVIYDLDPEPPETYFAANEVIKFKQVAEEKVPDEVYNMVIPQ